MLNSKVIGDQHGASVKAYGGLFNSHVIAGYGRWRDTVTPYAYGISDFLDLIGDLRDEPDNRLFVMPKNKAVGTYLSEYVPLWRGRRVNGQGEAVPGLAEWIKVADNYKENRFLLGTDFNVFGDEARKIDGILDQIGAIAEKQPPKEGQVVRVLLSALQVESCQND
jgi:hypothetical protein